MLQRAASNAYSWWWASHIRTKQSKWLEQSLQDMEEKVANAMNLVQKDGDSFAKRAEMYYKHRPELIAFIEESVRAYRALAERYDKLSTDLQKANTTIASVFPDQLPYDTDYDDDDNDNSGPKIPRNTGPDPPKAPKVPETIKAFLTNGPKKNQAKKLADNGFLKSGLTKEEAVEEIDKLQKDILSMQTVKEFTKSSYESGLAKLSAIENEIIEMQQRVCDLQDEFKVAKGIEDDDARAIMAEAALKSCEASLAELQARQDKTSQEARFEDERIQNVKQKLESFKLEYLQFGGDDEHIHENDTRNTIESKQNELHERINEAREALLKKPLTVTEMADMIDKLVNRIISLETLVSSQSALIDRLRIETDDLQMQIQNLEQDKANSIGVAPNLAKTFKEVEKKLDGVQDLRMNIENQNNMLKMHFTEAHCSVNHLLENIYDVKPDEEHAEEEEINNTITSETTEKQTYLVKSHSETTDKQTHPVKSHSEITDKQTYPVKSHSETTDDVVNPRKPEEETMETNWQELLSGGLDNKEKVLLQEYTTILRKYKAVKKELADEEQRNQQTVGEMRSLLAKQDDEIRQMKQKLQLLQETDNEQVMSEEVSVFIDKPDPVSAKLRADIDAVLDENLEFWLRFSSAFHQVQKFKTEVKDLQQEIVKVKSKGSTDGKRSEITAIFKHLKEIQTELTVWFEQRALLKNELQRRFASLFDIEEAIKRALREGVEEEEIKFNTHQAAKFQGEVSNMQQENNKVNQELEAGLSHVAALQLETEKTLKWLEDEFGQKQPNRPHVPLRSFIFGVKSKKQKPSILACINPLAASNIM